MRDRGTTRLAWTIFATAWLAFGGAGAEAGGIKLLTRWEVSEFPVSIPNGGRANGLAVHPSDARVMFAASESGGLFRSADAGATWRHVDALPCARLATVAILPSDPNVVLVTTVDDYKAQGGGGVWRSTDGGTSWTQAATPSPPGRRMAAYEIAVAPDDGTVYVGCEFGCLVSADRGATWARRTLPGGELQTLAVTALGNRVVLAAGPSGVFRSTDGGATWSQPTTAPGGVSDLHALAAAPYGNATVFVVNGDTRLFVTTDAGVNWVPIPDAPAGGGSCGGIAFIKAVRAPGLRSRQAMELYFGNRCGVSRLYCARNPLSGAFSFGGTWTPLSVDHGDIRDLAFDSARSPVLMATDGGLHRTADEGDTWTYTGAAGGGYNALQVTEVTGQTIDSAGRHDLYFGTQDNFVWYSGDAGQTWPKSAGGEGFFIECERRVTREGDAWSTAVLCGDCFNATFGPGLAGLTQWGDPPGALGGNPKVLGAGLRIQGVTKGTSLDEGLALTTDRGATWSQYAAFPESRLDLPKVARSTGRFLPSTTVTYQAVNTTYDPRLNDQLKQLVRVQEMVGRLPRRVHYPAMNGFGSLGINPTMFAWYEVFGVDPASPYHLIAPDVLGGAVKESRDGGENWTPISELTSLVNDGGRLGFVKDAIFPLVTVVSFCPQNPDFVLVGTAEGGLYLSDDNGAHWSRIRDSERIPFVTSIHWRSAGDILVSSYGRGLWRLKGEVWIPRPIWDDFCRPPCQIIWNPVPQGDPPPDLRVERGALVFEGRLQGVRLERGVVREVVVSPGSTVGFVSEEARPSGIRVRESSRPVGIEGTPEGRFPRPPQEGMVARGLVLARDGRLIGLAFGTPLEAMNEPPPGPQKDPGGSTGSPVARRPYLRIESTGRGGGPTVGPGERFGLVGERFPAGVPLVVVIDGKATDLTFTANADGLVRGTVPAPRALGFHTLELRRDNARGPVIDGSRFLVRPSDRDVEADRDRPGRPHGPDAPKPTPRD